MSRSLDAEVSEDFGRRPCFVIVDPETLLFEAFVNPACRMNGGARSAAVQELARRGTETVIAGRFSPKAKRSLEAAGVRCTVARGTVRDAIRARAVTETNG